MEKELFNQSEDQELSNSMTTLAPSLIRTESPKNYIKNKVYTKNKQKTSPTVMMGILDMLYTTDVAIALIKKLVNFVGGKGRSRMVFPVGYLLAVSLEVWLVWQR